MSEFLHVWANVTIPENVHGLCVLELLENNRPIVNSVVKKRKKLHASCLLTLHHIILSNGAITFRVYKKSKRGFEIPIDAPITHLEARL